MHDIWQADTRDNAQSAFDLFIDTYEDKYPKAATCLQKDREELMAFYDFPAKHWQSIRISNPATIRHRTKRSKGCLMEISHTPDLTIILDVFRVK